MRFFAVCCIIFSREFTPFAVPFWYEIFFKFCMFSAAQFSCNISLVDFTLFLTVTRFPYEIYTFRPL